MPKKKTEQDKTYRQCCWKGCTAHADYPAPIYKDFEQSDAPAPRQWFCLEHIRAFNQGWDFFDDMSADDIDAFQRAAIKGESVKEFGRKHSIHMEDHLYDKVQEFMYGEQWEAVSKEPIAEIGEDVRQAMRVLEVTMPLEMESVKRQYYRLAKRHHPDKVGQEGEQMLKTINHAYSTIKDHIKRYDYA